MSSCTARLCFPLFPSRILSDWAFSVLALHSNPPDPHPLLLGQSRPLPFLPHPHLCRGCPGCVSSPDLSPKLQISLSSPAWHLRLHTLGNKTRCLPSNPSLYRPYITQCPIPCVHRQSADLGASFNSLLVLFSHFPPFAEFHQHPSLSILTLIAEHGPHLLLPVIQSLLAYF